MIRKLDHTEIPQAIALSLEIFTLCGTEDFNEEGLETFKSFIHNESLMNELILYGAFNSREKLTGIIETKNNGKHISLFFIRKEYHRKGIGKQLFNYAIQHSPAPEITVNSSTYGVPFYQSLGFEIMGEVQECHGLKSIPMKRIAE